MNFLERVCLTEWAPHSPNSWFSEQDVDQCLTMSGQSQIITRRQRTRYSQCSNLSTFMNIFILKDRMCASVGWNPSASSYMVLGTVCEIRKGGKFCLNPMVLTQLHDKVEGKDLQLRSWILQCGLLNTNISLGNNT